VRRRVVLLVLTLSVAGCASGPRSQYPLNDLRGEYTVVAMDLFDAVGSNGTVEYRAVEEADRRAGLLRKRGLQAYVADMGDEALIIVGTYPDRSSAAQAARRVHHILEEIGPESAPRHTPGITPYPEKLDRVRQFVRRPRY